MRAPARLFGITLTVFIGFTLILSRFESDTVTRTINRFPIIKQQWQARAAAMQSHMSSSTSDPAACDVDAKSCSEAYTSHDKSTSKAKQLSDQTMEKEYDNAEAMEPSKDSKNRHPSTKDADRDKDRGFTDAEQAAALERLEFKYGDEAKADSTLLWMETSTTAMWGTGPTTAVDSEAEKARKYLAEEYGDSDSDTTTSTAADDAEPTEKGWRTTGFETKARTSQKSLISGGGGNGTATATGLAQATGELAEEVVATVATETATHIKTKVQTGKWADRTKLAEALMPENRKQARPTKKPAVEDEDEDEDEDVEAEEEDVDVDVEVEDEDDTGDDGFEEDERVAAKKESKKQKQKYPTSKYDTEELAAWKKAKKPVKGSKAASKWGALGHQEDDDEDTDPYSPEEGQLKEASSKSGSFADTPEQEDEEHGMFKNSKKPALTEVVDGFAILTDSKKRPAATGVEGSDSKSTKGRRPGDLA